MSIDAKDCPPAFVAEVENRIADDARDAAPQAIEMICSAGSVVVRVANANGLRERDVELANIPSKSRARLTALSLAELLLEEDAPSADEDERPAAKPPTTPTPPRATVAEDLAPESAPRARPPRAHVIGIGVTASSIGSDLLLVGPSLERHQAIAKGIALFGQAGCEFGSSSPFRDLGGDTVKATNASGMIALSTYLATGSVELHGRVGVRGGVVNLHGASSVAYGDTGSVTAGFLAPAVSVGLRTGVHARAGSAIHLEAGSVSGGVRGRVAGADPIAYHGKYVSLGTYLEL